MTLMEVLVVISIIGMLLSLLLPAVQAAREASRRAVCASNLRNVALALAGADNARRRLPASGNFSIGGTGYHNWVVDILPYLERADLHERWSFDQPASNPNNKALAQYQINVLICPDDHTVVRGQGNLSYVVNGGFGWTAPVDCPIVLHVPSANNLQTVPIDLNGNGVVCPSTGTQDGAPSDRTLYFWTGLLFPENWPSGSFTVRHRSLGDVSDGLSRTLLATENLRAGYDAAVGGTWASPLPWRNSFFLSGYICKDAKCGSGSVNWSEANDPSTYESINPRRVFDEGEAPWPSSNHPSGVNVVFCDGHLRFLSDDVDGRVYAALVTPEGNRITGALAQSVVGDLPE